jgi:hypothetical protein
MGRSPVEKSVCGLAVAVFVVGFVLGVFEKPTSIKLPALP